MPIKWLQLPIDSESSYLKKRKKERKKSYFLVMTKGKKLIKDPTSKL